MTNTRFAVLCLLCAGLAAAEIHQNSGPATPLPTDKYIHVVSLSDSPVQQNYIKTRDGLYVAAAIRKPKGDGPFPAMIMFHGAPGGRGMEQLVGWSRGDHGGPVWERFLQEGFVVAVADYRGGNMNLMSSPSTAMVTSTDDGLAVIDYVKALPYVDPARINLYGVSLGGNLVMNLISKVTVHSAIVGAPAAIWFLGIQLPPGGPGSGPDRFKDAKPDPEIARKNIDPIKTPVLILVGTADSLLPVATLLHDALAAAGKSVRMEVYEHGYHDFCLGPQGQTRRDLPQGEVLLPAALDALEKSVKFAK
jgi:dienelactone hydrolase